MKKICPRCGIIFEASKNQVFCSTKCEKIFKESSIGYIKKNSSERRVYAP